MILADIYKYSALAAWALMAGGLVWYALSFMSEVTYVTLADGRRQERRLPLVFRLLLPFAPNLFRFVNQPGFARSRETAEWQITASGFEGLLSAREFLAIKFLLPLVTAFVWFCLLQLLILIDNTLFPPQVVDGALTVSVFSENFLLLFMMGVLTAWMFPLSWLRGALKTRHRSIQRALPFVLDLLTLSVEAGMDFMSALQRNCERRRLDPLNEELIRMIREIQVGTSRRTALRNLAQRVRLSELKSVCSALIQADELGVSIGAILRIQSDQMRVQRFERAEKLANEAPTKMLLPLMLFIFPATLIVLLGPVISRAMAQLF